VARTIRLCGTNPAAEGVLNMRDDFYGFIVSFLEKTIQPSWKIEQ